MSNNTLYNATKLSNENYNCIDLFKFLASFLIIAIHIHPLSSINGILDFGLSYFICLLAVPYYFICSGFLLFRKIDLNNFDKERTLKYVKKIYKYYLIWTIIYFPLNLYGNIIHGENGIKYGIITYLRDIVFLGSYSHLWYLNATGIAVLIITFLLCKKWDLNRILLLSFVLYLIGLLAESYYVFLRILMNNAAVKSVITVLKQVIVTPRNGLSFGLLFICLGMMSCIKRITLKASIIGFFISFFAFAVEVLVVTKFNWAFYTEMYLFLIPSVFFLFHISINVHLPDSKIWKELRQSGILIYFTFLLVKRLMVEVLSSYEDVLENKHLYSIVLYILVSATSFVISIIIMRVSCLERFKWLKRIYT